jgi:FKBP-type peptidyl-prolyl cis-trans isomerase
MQSRVTKTTKLTPIVSHDQGWDESVLGMSIGEIAKIHCSPDYAYGPGGFPAWGIMPNSELIFEIEIVSYS